MRSTRTIIFGCALVAAALVFLGILRAIKSSNPSSTATPPVAVAAATPGAGPVNVAVRSGGDVAEAATDIPAGSIVTREMLRLTPAKGSTTGFVTDINSQAAGFITRVAIPAGSQLRPADDFIGHISQVGIAGALRPGTRALVLPLPGKPTLHDLVKIGNSVDIIAAFDGQESRTIAQNLRVLAVDVFANDFPQVNAAMRGPYKADPMGQGIAASPSAPGASNAGNASAGAAPGVAVPQATPTEAPTPVPANAPRPDPALTLEVTPQQAAAIQLALAANAPLDFLVRPALPGNRSGEVSLVSDDGTPDGGTTVTSVIKPQIAPYAEFVKNGKNRGGSSANAGRNNGNNGGGNGGSSGERIARTPRFPVPDLPPITETQTTPDLPTPFVPPAPVRVNSGADFGGNGNNGGAGNNGGSRLSPAAPSTYQIPIYSDGGVVRTETVPVPIR